jgi:hypothetical protein
MNSVSPAQCLRQTQTDHAHSHIELVEIPAEELTKTLV